MVDGGCSKLREEDDVSCKGSDLNFHEKAW
jgi:hypothetical protein